MAPKDDISRRTFLKTVGGSSLAAGLIVPADAAQPGMAVIGPGEVPVRLIVNGTRHDLSLEPRVTLLDALRTRLDITGLKRVCDRGSCGACTMIVDGRAVYSCSMLAIEAQGASIRTVEGLAAGADLHRLQEAFCKTDGLMCGFCTPGFVVAGVALLDKVPKPTVAQAREGLDGNICRCGTYARVLEAVLATGSPRRAEAGELAPVLADLPFDDGSGHPELRRGVKVRGYESAVTSQNDERSGAGRRGPASGARL